MLLAINSETRRLSRSVIQEVIRYVLLGAALYGGSLVVMLILTTALGLGEVTAYAVLQVLISCSSFMVARHWVFRASRERLATQAGLFVASGLAFRALNFGVYSLLWVLLEPPREIGILATLVVLFPLKYGVEKTLVFRQRGR